MDLSSSLDLTRRDRLYLDIDKDFLKEGTNVLIECHRLNDPTDATEMNNDMFVKKYTALMKGRWRYEFDQV